MKTLVPNWSEWQTYDSRAYKFTTLNNENSDEPL